MWRMRDFLRLATLSRTEDLRQRNELLDELEQALTFEIHLKTPATTMCCDGHSYREVEVKPDGDHR